MKYRTKVMVLVIALAVVTGTGFTLLSYLFSRHLLIGQIQSQVLSIAATAATLVDGDLHQQIQTSADEGDRPYHALEQQLRKVRDANRRNDVHIGYVYTMVESDQADSGIAFVVDAEETHTGNKSHVGDPYEPQSDDMEPLDMGSYQIDPVVRDEFGTWVSANAPVHDSRGQTVAALGVDLSVEQVLNKTHAFLVRSVQATLVALVFAIVIAVYLSRRVAHPVEVLSRAVEQIGQGHLDTRVQLKSRDEFGQLGHAVNRMAVALGESKTLRGALARYLSYQVAEDVLRSGTIPTLRGQRRKVSVLFLDIRGFLDMTIALDPETVVGLLNEFFDRMVEIVFRQKGTLDKFIGDGLMVLFGAPLDDPDQEEHAITAALEMHRESQKLSRQWRARGLGGLRIGIGINTGISVVGNIGSMQRMDYTAIGGTVGVASRLEAATKTLGYDVLVSETTYLSVKDKVSAVRVGEVVGGADQSHVGVYGLEQTACDDTASTTMNLQVVSTRGQGPNSSKKG